MKPRSAMLLIYDVLEIGILDYIVPTIPGNLMDRDAKRWLEDKEFLHQK